jgi:hypothetical protein
VEDVLSCVEQKTQVFRKELTEKIDKTKVDLQTVKASLDTRIKSLHENLGDTWEDFHEELGLMFQVEAQTTKSEIRINQKRWKSRLSQHDASYRRG